ncbi:MAG: beta-ketoacyl-ACP synthase III [Candidatus Omnitrophota bacterium]
MPVKVGIIGVGEYLPKKVLTNADLEKMVETSDEWITTRTGIKERRIASSSEACSDMALKAAKEAVAHAGIEAKDIDLIIVATITPDMPFPSVACMLQEGIGASKAICFDISGACAGFVYAIITAQQFISAGTCRNALVVGSEKLSTITDWEDRNTCVLFGDGAAAAVLSEVNSGGIISHYMASDGAMKDLLLVPAGGSRNPATQETVAGRMHYIRMRGNELFKIAVKAMSEAAEKSLEKAGLTAQDLDLFIPHQANMRIISAVAKRLGLPEEKVFINIDKYGNMSSASTATALCEAVKSGRIKKGDIVMLDAFGAGLVWGSCIIKW